MVMFVDPRTAERWDIPLDKVKEFRKDIPDAKPAYGYEVEGERYYIPEPLINDFLKDNPQAKLIYDPLEPEEPVITPPPTSPPKIGVPTLEFQRGIEEPLEYRYGESAVVRQKIPPPPEVSMPEGVESQEVRLPMPAPPSEPTGPSLLQRAAEGIQRQVEREKRYFQIKTPGEILKDIGRSTVSLITGAAEVGMYARGLYPFKFLGDFVSAAVSGYASLGKLGKELATTGDFDQALQKTAEWMQSPEGFIAKMEDVKARIPVISPQTELGKAAWSLVDAAFSGIQKGVAATVSHVLRESGATKDEHLNEFLSEVTADVVVNTLPLAGAASGKIAREVKKAEVEIADKLILKNKDAIVRFADRIAKSDSPFARLGAKTVEVVKDIQSRVDEYKVQDLINRTKKFQDDLYKALRNGEITPEQHEYLLSKLDAAYKGQIVRELEDFKAPFKKLWDQVEESLNKGEITPEDAYYYLDKVMDAYRAEGLKRGYYIKTPEYGKMWEQAVTEAEAIAGVTEAMRKRRTLDISEIQKYVEEAQKKMGELEERMGKAGTSLSAARDLPQLSARLLEAVEEYRTGQKPETAKELGQYVEQLRALSQTEGDVPQRLSAVLDAYIRTRNQIYIPLIRKLHEQLTQTPPTPDYASVLVSLIDTYRQGKKPEVLKAVGEAKERLIAEKSGQLSDETIGKLNLKLGELMDEYSRTKDGSLLPLIDTLKTVTSELKAARPVKEPEPAVPPSPSDVRKKYGVELPRWKGELRAEKTTETPLRSVSDERFMHVYSAVDEFISRLGIDKEKVVVYRGPSDFPDHIKPYTEGHRIYAWYENGKVHLNAAEMTDRHAIHRILFEELINHGYFPEAVRAAGDDINRFYATVYKLYRNDPVMQKVVEDYGIDTTTTAGIIRAGKEYFAHHKYNALSNPTLLERFVMLIREMLRKLGIDLGMSKTELDKYIREMTVKALERVRSESRETGPPDFVLTRAPKDVTKKAEEMKAKGASDEQIWKELGVYKDSRGNWRSEIPDIAMQVKETRPGRYKLKDIVHHPELFEKYPQLREAEVVLAYSPDKPSSVHREPSNPWKFVIEINGDRVDVKSKLIHEIQHAVNMIEGYSKNKPVREVEVPDTTHLVEILDRAKRNMQVLKSAYTSKATSAVLIDELTGESVLFDLRKNDPQMRYLRSRQIADNVETVLLLRQRKERLEYLRDPDEVEARIAQRRLEMTPEEVKITPPEPDFLIKSVKLKDGKVLSREEYAKLSPKDREKIHENIEKVDRVYFTLAGQTKRYYKEVRGKVAAGEGEYHSILPDAEETIAKLTGLRREYVKNNPGITSPTDPRPLDLSPTNIVADPKRLRELITTDPKHKFTELVTKTFRYTPDDVTDDVLKYLWFVYSNSSKLTLNPNTKTGLSLDLSSICPTRAYLGKECTYCYRSSPFYSLILGLSEGKGYNPKTEYSLPYRHELLYMPKELVEKINKDFGGLRVYSFSDYWPVTDYEMIKQVIADAQKIGLKLKFITKQPQYLLRDFGHIPNAYFNISIDLVDEMLSEIAGKKVRYSNAPSLEEALKWKKKYPDRVAIRGVALNREQARKLHEMGVIDVITAYHGPTNFSSKGQRTNALYKIVKAQNPSLYELLGEEKFRKFTDMFEDMGSSKQKYKELAREFPERLCCVGGKCATCRRSGAACGFREFDEHTLLPGIHLAKDAEKVNVPNRMLQPEPEFKLEKKEPKETDLNPVMTLRTLGASADEIKAVINTDTPPARLTLEHAPFEFLMSRVFGDWNVERVVKESGIQFEKLPPPYKDLHGTTLRNRIKQYVMFPRRVAEKYPQAYPLYEAIAGYKTNELKYKSEYLEMMRDYLTLMDEESLLRVNKFLSDRMQAEHKALKSRSAPQLVEITPEYLSSLGFSQAEVDAIMAVRKMTQRIAEDLKNETLNRMWMYDEYAVPATSQQILDIIRQEKEKLHDVIEKYKEKPTAKNFENVKRGINRIRSMHELKRIVNHFEILQNMTYIPHTRPTGKYYIVGVDAHGKVQYYNRYNNARELKEILADLEGSGLNIRTGVEYKAKVPEILHMPPYFVVLLKNAIEKLKAVGALDEGTKDLDAEISKLMNAWGLRGKVGKHFITPRFIAGYDYRYMRQALTKYVLSVGSLRARNHMYEQYRNALDKLHMERDAPLINYFTTVRDAMLTPTHPAIAHIKALMFLTYLGGNFKNFVINLLQPVTMTWGYTTRYTGIRHGTVLNYKAMQMALDYQLGRRDRLPSDLVAFLDEKQKTGEINPQTVRELVGLGLRGEMSKFERAVDYSAFLFNIAERNNRTHASIVAYLLGKEKGLKGKALEKFTRQFVGDTQIYYEKAERPLLFSHRYLEVAGIYRMYAWNFMSLMKELVKHKDFKALGHILGVHFLLGGAIGLPWVSDILQLLAKLGVDIEDMLREETDPELANVLVYGVPALSGISIGQALAPTAVDVSEIGTTTGLIRSVLGVTGDFITRVPKAVTLYYHNKDLWRAAEYFLPESLRNIATSIRWQVEEGIRTPTLQKLSDADVYDSVLRSLGLQPVKVMHAYRQSLREQLARHAADVDTRDYNLRVAKALFRGDMDELAKIYEEVMDHNMKCIQKGEFHKVIKLSDRAIRMNLLRMVDPETYKVMITRELARPEIMEIQRRWEVGR